MLTAEGTSGRAWKCDQCGVTWPPYGQHEAARLFLAGALAGYLDREGWKLLRRDGQLIAVASAGLRLHITVQYSGPLTDAELVAIAGRQGVELTPLGRAVAELGRRDAEFLASCEPGCDDCTAAGGACHRHYHARLTVLGLAGPDEGAGDGSSDRSSYGA